MNKPKPFNWFFNWNVGGYNTVSASTRSEALEKAQEKGEGWRSGGVNESTLKPDPDFKTTAQWDQRYAGMFN